MSTNYYFNIQLGKSTLSSNLDLNCYLLGQVDTYLHIGMRSAGWVPLFHKTEFYDSVKGIKEFYLKNEELLVIEDEYGWEMSLEELEDELFSWDGGPIAKGNPIDRSEVDYPTYVDEEGNVFTELEFS